MTSSPSGEETDRGDMFWNRAVDNAVILMSLTVTHFVIKSWQGNPRIKGLLIKRLNKLITRYKDPNV